MIKAALTDLSAVYGNFAASALASAYESAILTLSHGEWQHMPNRSVRITLVEAMMAEGEQNGFTAQRMAEVGLAAVAVPATPGELST